MLSSPTCRAKQVVLLLALVATAPRALEAGGSETSRDTWWVRPVARPVLPAVRDPRWARDPIDILILARLEAAGLEPSPPADRATFIRRASLDLLGLPPDPDQVDAFVADESPDAYETLIDRLLASPRHGERWGRHWLDLARFAESHGFEYDRPRDNAWPYRDYVIGSFNSDKPYLDFVREQIAGDVLEPFSVEGLAATGFLVAGPWDEAGNLQKSDLMRSRMREEEMEDIVSAVCQTFLGVTVHCARCHDHKFDPIPQRDYYSFRAALAGVGRADRPLLTPEEATERQKRKARLEGRLAAGERRAAALVRAGRERVLATRGTRLDASLPAPFARWTFDRAAEDSAGSLHGSLHGGARVKDGRLLLDGRGAYFRTETLETDLPEKTLEVWVSLSNLEQRGGGAISLEAAEGGAFDAIVFGERVPRRWLAGSEIFKRSRDLDAPDESAGPDELIHIAATYGPGGRIALYRNGEPYGEAYTPASAGDKPAERPARGPRVLLGLRHTGAGNGFFDGDIEEARLHAHALSPDEVRASYLASPASVPLEAALEALSPAERADRDAAKVDESRSRASLALIHDPPLAYTASPLDPGETHVLQRGDVEAKGERVAAGGLSAIASPAPEFGLRPGAPEAEGRRALASWIASPENPLTARVIVNRIWQHHFGRGLVATPSDFGSSGERPSHPELLDLLAGDLVRAGFRLKPIHRRILLSSTFRQSSEPREAALEVDAETRLLWRFPPRRLEGEAVRDVMLHYSGHLNLQAGGPGFRPFTVRVSGSHLYTVTDPEGPEFDRRTVYRMGINSAKAPLLDALDCPDPSVKTPWRAVTTTPLQALGLMNSPFVTREAARFAARVLKEAEGPEQQAARAYRLALGRGPTPIEAAEAAALTRDHGLETLCWALFNSSELLYLR